MNELLEQVRKLVRAALVDVTDSSEAVDGLQDFVDGVGDVVREELDRTYGEGTSDDIV